MIEIGGVQWRSWSEVCHAMGLKSRYTIPADPEGWVMRRLSITDRSQLAPMMRELKARYLGIDPGLTLSSGAKEALGAMLDTASLDGVRAATGMSLEHLLEALAELRRLADGM